jgi:hypothetical protein
MQAQTQSRCKRLPPRTPADATCPTQRCPPRRPLCPLHERPGRLRGAEGRLRTQDPPAGRPARGARKRCRAGGRSPKAVATTRRRVTASGGAGGVRATRRACGSSGRCPCRGVQPAAREKSGRARAATGEVDELYPGTGRNGWLCPDLTRLAASHAGRPGAAIAGEGRDPSALCSWAKSPSELDAKRLDEKPPWPCFHRPATRAVTPWRVRPDRRSRRQPIRREARTHVEGAVGPRSSRCARCS